MAFCGVFSWNERIYSVFQALFKANLAVKLDGLSRSEWVGMLRFRQYEVNIEHKGFETNKKLLVYKNDKRILCQDALN